MKKTIIRNAWGFEPLPEDFEQVSGEDMTVPDDSYSIQQILTQFSNGIRPNIALDGYYSDTEDFEDYDRFSDPDFDLTDLSDIKSSVEKTLSVQSKKQPLQTTQQTDTETDTDSLPDNPPQ
ncbi:MAG: hypothetical protein [Microvirus sp.]|nr:MAG: hypothetical protein [Microvirus sp.]